MLDVVGVTSVEDRSRNGSQADFPVLLPINRTGLLLRPKVIAIHLTFSLNKFGPVAGGVEQTEVKKRPHITDIRWRLIAPYQDDPRLIRAVPNASAQPTQSQFTRNARASLQFSRALVD
jgi:hypothetical protein